MGRFLVVLAVTAGVGLFVLIMRRRWPCTDCGWLVACGRCSAVMDEAERGSSLEPMAEMEQEMPTILDDYHQM